MVRLPRNKKQTYGVNLRAQIYQIVTGVTSVVGVPSTHLVIIIIIISKLKELIYQIHMVIHLAATPWCHEQE